MKLCPSEAAIQYRLQYKEPLLGERAFFGTKSIKDSVGREGFFSLYRFDDDTLLFGMFFESTEKLRPYNSFVFSL